MNSYLVLTFATSSGKDLTINMPDADETLSNTEVYTAMNAIKTANAIAGVEQLQSPRAAVLHRVERKEFAIA